jgi:hypothetical protein
MADEGRQGSQGPSIADARGIGVRTGRRVVVVVTMDDDGHVLAASWGASRGDCGDASRLMVGMLRGCKAAAAHDALAAEEPDEDGGAARAPARRRRT